MSAARTRLSIDAGTSTTAAAVDRGQGAVLVDLGGGAAPSTVALVDGAVVVGTAAEAAVAAHPDAGVRELRRRFGDTTPVVLGGTAFTADALTTELLRSVAAAAGVTPTDTDLVLSHPTSWHAYKRELLAACGSAAGFASVTTVTEAEAAVRAAVAAGRVRPGSTVAVYDLGGTFEASVVAVGEQGTKVVGQPQALERVGGDVLDQLVFRHVGDALGGNLQQLDRSDPAVRAAIAELRAECTAAKERLSSDSETSVAVRAPGLDTRVRITRDEFETAARPIVNDTLAALDRALASAGVAAGDLAGVVLAGAGAQVPVVAEMVAGHTGRPLLGDGPATVVVRGALAEPTVPAAAPASSPVPTAATTAAAAVAATEAVAAAADPAAAAPVVAAAAASVPSPDTSHTSESRETPMSDQPTSDSPAAPAGAGARRVAAPPPPPARKVSSKAAGVAGGLAAVAAALTAAVFYGDDVVDAFDGPDGDAGSAGFGDTRTADRAEREAARDDTGDDTGDDSMDAFDAVGDGGAPQGAAVGTPLAPPAPEQASFARPAPQQHRPQRPQFDDGDDDGPAPVRHAAAAGMGAAAAGAGAAAAADTDFEAARAQLLARLDAFEAPEGTSPEDAQALKDELRDTIERFEPRAGQSTDDALADLRDEFDETVQDFTQDQRIDALIDEVARDNAEEAADDAAPADDTPPLPDESSATDDTAADDTAADDTAADDTAADDAPVDDAPADDADDGGLRIDPSLVDVGVLNPDGLVAPGVIGPDGEPLRIDPDLVVDLATADAGEAVADDAPPITVDPSVLPDPAIEVDVDRGGIGRASVTPLFDDGFDELTVAEDPDAGGEIAEDPDAGGEIGGPGRFVGDSYQPDVRATMPAGTTPTMMTDLGDDTFQQVQDAVEVEPTGILIGLDQPGLDQAVVDAPLADAPLAAGAFAEAPIEEVPVIPEPEPEPMVMVEVDAPIEAMDDVDLDDGPGLAAELHSDITPDAPDNLQFGG